MTREEAKALVKQLTPEELRKLAAFLDALEAKRCLKE